VVLFEAGHVKISGLVAFSHCSKVSLLGPLDIKTCPQLRPPFFLYETSQFSVFSSCHKDQLTINLRPLFVRSEGGLIRGTSL